MIYLIPSNKKQYKANLHSHSTLSDGNKTPEELKEMYKAHGYSVLSITDHERPYCHQSLSEEDFILLTGYECYIRPHPLGKYKPYNKEVHLNLFARDPNNVKMICCNECYCRYVKRDNAFESLERVGSERPREFTTEYINEYIQTALDNGYLVSYNHPYWSMENEAEILSYEGIFSVEIVNYSSYLANALENSSALYEKMLLAGKRVFCHSADDNHNVKPVDHPRSDSFGGFAMIFPEEFSYSGIINAMEKGEMYASMGPTIKELSVEGDTLHLECSEVEHVYLYVGSKRVVSTHAFPGEPLITTADLLIDAKARFVRVAIQDKEGRWAHTRGYFRDEIGFPPLEQ
jgi:hypothetical protein